MSELGIRRTTPLDLLGHLNNTETRFAPPELFIAGNPALASGRFKVAIIGSRRASRSGLERAAEVAAFLAQHKIVVVSGLAEGIDRAAHLAAIEHHGDTIAVIGTGLDKAFPPQHGDLQRQLMRDHLVVSQFPIGTHPDRRNFPQRNRLMALLCDASVIIEAGQTSGTVHQGWEALRLGRPLFLDRSIVSAAATLDWPAKMMEYGSHTLNDPREILELLGEERPAGSTRELAF